MFDELERLKIRYAQQIEDGRRIEVFTSMPEWQWYVEHVLQPTIEEQTKKVMEGKLENEKADWLSRGIVMGMQMVIDGTSGMIRAGQEAKKKAKAQAQFEKEER